MNFTILTISMRHHFLPSVSRSISEAVIPDGVDVRWKLKMNPAHKIPWEKHIEIWDSEVRALSGTWFMFLSDDNALHPSLIRRWSELIAQNPNMKALHVRQQHGATQFRPAGIDHLNGGHCDGGQVLFDADFYNSFAWSYAQFGYEGFLFRKMWERNPEAFVFADELLAYHDRLNW